MFCYFSMHLSLPAVFTELYNELKRMSVAYFPVSEVRIFFNFLPHLEPKVDQKGTKIFEKRRDNQMSVK